MERFIEINIYNNQVILVLSINDRWKRIKTQSYISVCDNKISGCALFNKCNLNLYTNDEMGYIGMYKLIKSEVLYCILQKKKKKECKGSGEISKAKNIKGLGVINTTKITNT